MANNKGNWVAWVALIGVVALAGVIFLSDEKARQAFGAAGGMLAENYIPYVQYNDGYASAKEVSTSGLLESTGSFVVGSNGTTLAGIKAGNCTIWAGAATIAATSTQQVVCQSATTGALSSGLTGVTADSICNVRSASSSVTVLGGLSIQGVSASSTAGNIVVQVANFTGTTFTWSAAASSSWTYSCFDPA